MFSMKALYLLAFILLQKSNFILSECIHGDYYSSSSDCGVFYQCAHGQLFELRCPAGLYFNPSVNVCDFPINVNCDITTTTSHTPTTTTEPPSTTTTEIPSTTPEITEGPPTSAPQICQWAPGQEIVIGNRCDAPNGYFVFQLDGNAVIYDSNNRALWNTETAGIGHTFVFQTDGNLVMYSSTGIAVWNSRSHDQGGVLLVFQQDRNLVIYDSAKVALWNAGTFIQ